MSGGGGGGGAVRARFGSGSRARITWRLARGSQLWWCWQQPGAWCFWLCFPRGSEKQDRVSEERLTGAWGEGPARAAPGQDPCGWIDRISKARCRCGGRLPRGTLDFSAARHLVPVSSRRGCIQVLPCSRFRRRGRGGSERDPDGARAFPLHLRPPWGGGGWYKS